MHTLSLIKGCVDFARVHSGVETGVHVVSAVEGGGERLGSGEVLGGEILLIRHSTSVILVGSLIDKVLLQALTRVLDVVSVAHRELLWGHVLLLNLGHIILNSSVNLSVKFAGLSHGLGA